MSQHRETLESYLAHGGTVSKVPIHKPPTRKELLCRYAALHKQQYAHGEKEVAKILEHLCINYEFQKIMGHYIVDFYLSDYNLIIEVDGASHQWRKQRRRDVIRDHYFLRRNIITIRIPANSPTEDKIKNVLQGYAGRLI